MRKLVVIEFLSLDGVYQAPGDPNEDTEGGFRHGGWQRPYFDDVLGEASVDGTAGTDAHLFGRKTYEIMAAYWPTAPADDTYAKHLNSVAKYVASGTLRSVDWQGSTLIEGGVAAEVAKLKEAREEDRGHGQRRPGSDPHGARPGGRVLPDGVSDRAGQRGSALPGCRTGPAPQPRRFEGDRHRRPYAHVPASPIGTEAPSDH